MQTHIHTHTHTTDNRHTHALAHIRARLQVSLGFQHGAALTHNGRVATWGKGERGQLGNGLTDNSAEPVLCHMFTIVTTINNVHFNIHKCTYAHMDNTLSLSHSI